MSIKKMIYGMIALLIIISFASSASTFAVLNQNKDNGKIVNYTGVVRGAGQRAVKLYLLDADAEKVLSRISTLMDGLLQGDAALGLPKPSNKEYIADMEKVKEYWNNNILPQFSEPVQDSDKELILSSSEEFFALADTAVSSAEAFTAQGIIWLKIMSVATFVINLLCMVLVGSIIKRQVLAPMVIIEKTMNRLAEGDLQTQMEYESNNELGHMADSIRTSFHILYKYIKDIDRAMGEMSKGNYDLEPTEPFIGDFKGIEDSITRFIIDISDTFNHLGEASSQVNSGADQVCQAAQSLAEGTVEQASAVEILMNSVTAITKQVQENAESAERASKMAENASAAVVQSNEKMQALEQAMEKINTKSGEIGKIIKTIEDIAFQTNILALNAAVEAARAGAAGKGFAVVADEVRNLASKSAEAAKNTTQLIEDSVLSISEGVGMAKDTAQALLSIVDSTTATKDEITEISRASKEQAEALNKVSMGVERISSVIHTNSATSEESAAASEELSGQATLMNEFINKFHVKDAAAVEEMKKIFH